MAPSLLSVFIVGAGLSFVLYILLSLGLLLLLRLAEFHSPSAKRLAKPYVLWYLAASVMSGLTAAYVYWQEAEPSVESATVALFVGAIIWGVVLIAGDLLFSKPD